MDVDVGVDVDVDVDVDADVCLQWKQCCDGAHGGTCADVLLLV